jgi:aspartate kinase
MILFGEVPDSLATASGGVPSNLGIQAVASYWNSYQLLELASLGAGVMHSRSIEFAKKYDVPIHVRSSATDTPGTMIVATPESPTQSVSGAAVTKDEALITITGVPGTSLEIFSRIADRKVTVDMIVQNVGEQGKADVSFRRAPR